MIFPLTELQNRADAAAEPVLQSNANPLPIKKICVIGFPSKLGGADTELDHQITLWREMGLEVHLIHTGEFDRNGEVMKQSVEDLGCVVHRSCDWSAAAGMHVISYCNGGGEASSGNSAVCQDDHLCRLHDLGF